MFEEWVRHSCGPRLRSALRRDVEAYFGRHLLCIHAPAPRYGPALEHNGDLYSCDHFVEPRYSRNIHETHMLKLVSSPNSASLETTNAIRLPRSAGIARSGRYATVDVRNTGSQFSRDGEPGQNYLCVGWVVLHPHTPGDANDGTMIEQRRPPSDVMALTAAEDDVRGPYQPCPCGSGRSSASAHGNNAPTSPFSGVTPMTDGSHDGDIAPMQTAHLTTCSFFLVFLFSRLSLVTLENRDPT